MQVNHLYSQQLIERLNQNIKDYFPHLFLIDTEKMTKSFSSVSRMVLLDRYAQKDINHQTISVGDLVVCVIKEDPNFPTRGIGYIEKIDGTDAFIRLEDEYITMSNELDANNLIKKQIMEVDKPLELFYEQICHRVANNLAHGETLDRVNQFYSELNEMNLVPAGRVLFGAGSNTSVTFFNCFVMPFIHDSRGGISVHRQQVMEIMSRGGGVGTNGSTLRPKNSLAKGVSGKSSGSVSWLNDLSTLTHLVEQGGSRRGAQMIMLADWHPDIIKFIISKMQNPKILLFLIDNLTDEEILKEAKDKLKFTPLSSEEEEMYETIIEMEEINPGNISKNTLQKAREILSQGGKYSVNNPDFLSGANISVAITKEFMYAVEHDLDYQLKFPDTDNYSKGEKAAYDEKWQACGDVREWEKMGYRVKTYKTLKAKELWNLISICATYSAEPGIFFIDNANDMTNAISYGQKVVCSNPCGEQPLAPYSVCNLAAINLANMINWEKLDVDWKKLYKTIKVAVRMQDNVIDKTTYFLEENKKQALGERRIGLGVMGLHDLIIFCNLRYGSPKANKFVDKLFEFIATSSYEQSIELAKEKGSFPFLDQYGSRQKFIESGFMKKMPKHIRNQILEHGIRNSHLLTIAPTGSTGTMVGVSTGLEPYFAFKYYRSGRLGKFMEVKAEVVNKYLEHNPEYSHDNLPDIFVNAMELTADEHADVQCIIQRWVDSSISKTVNAPKDYTVEDVEKLYMRLYKGNAKGGTVYVDGSRDTQVLTLKKEDDLPKQVELQDLGIEIEEKTVKKEQYDVNPPSSKSNRNIGVEVGDICPLCNEGIVENIGGCNTCTNCNAQLKCGL
ncbi:MAG: vitamin B12-dependent ribonucleotide reductase [Bacilli bacterium]|jgi:ribonucleoside-diphosphate reductase alpha chain|nr:vitamin B12-dependent ribonucleotide reductase [Bacilli bacterium]MDD2681854.1 vitamin B12-dependent ribonucleotide reductase [Bacilli bacterium]MDD3121317.1 vitamin B12-dependent ribonucleotide reductase [Bacilli bacterium]MDD4063432.1 vitamin B12-dependent ribonucleotide reductase [Bacilli bacterium]MDD4482093.1 vitamin B12-dependent ribonucleotide reductase [Bacilli bacterium]